MKCLNCGQEVTGKFCASCGQRGDLGRITFRDTIADFLSTLFLIDGPLPQTLKWLITNPGRLYREFLGGRRKTYYKPLPFFVLCTLLYLVIRSLLHYDPLEGSFENASADARPIGAMMKKASYFMVAYINHIMFILALVLGLFHKMFFPKAYNLAEYTAVGFYISGVYILAGTLEMITTVYIYPVPKAVQLGFLVAYTFISILSLHRSYKLWSIIRALLAGVFSLIFYMIFGFGVSVLIVWLMG
ncbi:MAG: DUF3667 domain-containing protein [Flavobacteriales bacterium]|nr:DUF3667 domain-containing protein [Flavobacteriales bacterium]